MVNWMVIGSKGISSHKQLLEGEVVGSRLDVHVWITIREKTTGEKQGLKK